ncbi:hypothetical protein HY492_02905 [Candidatus Woesearchaeota archaeon]|nr:hypothetical protein [Candidatus Woesearchaeota archaeon]
MEKRGQAAMEFLMTYGWALLVVLAAIAALAYFGVLSPDRFLPEKCFLPSGTPCLDSTLTATTATLIIQNSLGFSLSNITVTACGGSATTPATLSNGEQGTYAVTCSPALTSGDKFKGTVTFAYTNVDTGLAHTTSGELIKKVE